MRRLVHGLFIPLCTVFFGSLAILGCLVVPNGNPLIWLARPWARGILFTSRVRVRVRGREGIPANRPVVFVTNHQSHFDVLALIHALPGQYRVVAKKELFAIPIFGWALWLAGFIKIDRGDREKAFRSLDRAATKIRKGKSVVIFAEGTRSPDGRLQPFKKGGFILAIRSRCPIVPVTVSGSRAVLARNSLDIRPGTIDVVIGEAIPTSSLGLDDRQDLIRRVREAVDKGFTDRHRLDLDPPAGGALADGSSPACP